MGKQYTWPLPRREDDHHEWAKRLYIALTEYTDDQMNVDIAASGTDHGGLTGLTDDDHTQYLLATGTRVASEIRLDPKASSSGPEGTVYYDSDDDHIYVGTE